MWIREEIKFHHFRLNKIELSIYEMHLKLSKEFLYPDEWFFYIEKVDSIVDQILEDKLRVQQWKLEKLMQYKKTDEKLPEIIPNFVKNLSSETFSEDEMNLLNHGLNFALPPKTDKIKNFVIDVEAGIGMLEYFKKAPLNDADKEEIRMTAKNHIIKNKFNLQTSKETKEKEKYELKICERKRFIIPNLTKETAW